MRLTNHHNTSIDYRRARALRNDASPVEKKLWPFLRGAAGAAGLKFRRQQAIHPYIADFACMEARLLVELDGDTHASRAAYDDTRDKKLRDLGFVVLRYTNDDIMRNAEGIAMDIVSRTARLLKDKEARGMRSSPLPPSLRPCCRKNVPRTFFFFGNKPREGEGIPMCSCRSPILELEQYPPNDTPT